MLNVNQELIKYSFNEVLTTDDFSLLQDILTSQNYGVEPLYNSVGVKDFAKHIISLKAILQHDKWRDLTAVIEETLRKKNPLFISKCVDFFKELL